MFCLAVSLLTLAFANDALKEDGIQCPEDLFAFEIPHFTEAFAIQRKSERLETPIFRR